MNLKAVATRAFEAAPVPDALSRLAIKTLVMRTSRTLSGSDDEAARTFAEAMSAYPVAAQTDAANRQHYEVPAAFFECVLGPQRKYSCCLYDTRSSTLAEAEELALETSAKNAALADGQTILELGCGWGSLTLWMARRFPNASILAVSNSSSQRAYILDTATRQGLSNIRVVTADMNAFATTETFDRIVSIEMFEHMSNWRKLLERMHAWLTPDGRAFIHVFAHRATPYRFDNDRDDDWIAEHFFTGGIMPSHRLMYQFTDLFHVEQDWRWNGENYARTADDWLNNFDKNRNRIAEILAPVYGTETSLWLRRWRLFFLATSGLFEFRDGQEWGISQYRLRRSH
ncbi:MAG: cyclopropane-fatty-acyl-phospholipid synthase family protein [Hyphomicrobiaceae bacterium]